MSSNNSYCINFISRSARRRKKRINFTLFVHNVRCVCVCWTDDDNDYDDENSLLGTTRIFGAFNSIIIFDYYQQ